MSVMTGANSSNDQRPLHVWDAHPGLLVKIFPKEAMQRTNTAQLRAPHHRTDRRNTAIV